METKSFLLCMEQHRSLSMLSEMQLGEEKYFELSPRNFNMSLIRTTEFYIDINIINHASVLLFIVDLIRQKKQAKRRWPTLLI